MHSTAVEISSFGLRRRANIRCNGSERKRELRIWNGLTCIEASGWPWKWLRVYIYRERETWKEFMSCYERQPPNNMASRCVTGWLRSLEPWGRRFDSHLGHECVSVYYVQGGSNMTGTDLCVNKPHCAAAVRPWESEATTSTLSAARVRTFSVLSGSC